MRLAAADHRLSQWEDLLDELTPRQITTLAAFQRIETWGEEREDNRVAVAVSAICTAVSVGGRVIDPELILEMLKPKKKPEGFSSPDQVAAMMARTKTVEK
jgi:hypothetical protein